MKHALILTTIFPNAAHPGFGAFIARSMQALAKRGDWQVSVINPIGLPPFGLSQFSTRYSALAELPETAHQPGLSVHHPRFALIPKIGSRWNAASIARACLPMVRALHAQTPIHVVDAQFFFPDGPAAARLAQAICAPLTIKARGSDINFWGKVPHARKAMVQAGEQAKGLLAVSGKLAREMACMGLPKDKIAVHYTGLDRDRFRPLGHTQLRAQLSQALNFKLPDNAPLFACVGALNGLKGQAIAIEALGLVSNRYPEARLILVGEGNQAEALRAQAMSSGLAQNVLLTGAVDHDLLPVILSAADAMVLPTWNEGLANAWVEALACGTPVVTTEVGGAREVITNAQAGRLVERDAQSVANAMLDLLHDPPDPQAVAACVEPFDWTTHARELARYYEQISTQPIKRA